MDAKTRRETLTWTRNMKKEMDNQIHALFLLKKSVVKLEEMLLENGF